MRQDHLGGLRPHVSQVMAGVPAARRCAGHPKDTAAPGSKLRRLFGRG